MQTIDPSELSPVERDALAAAKAVCAKAYAPYSSFPVGAALVAEGEEIFAGCNVENASFGLTICAERSAALQAVARGQRFFLLLAVFAPTAEPTPPCGACRQFLAEFAPDLRVLVEDRGGQVVFASLCDLLPARFGPGGLAGGTELA